MNIKNQVIFLFLVTFSGAYAWLFSLKKKPTVIANNPVHTQVQHKKPQDTSTIKKKKSLIEPKGAVVVVSLGDTDDGKGKICDFLAKDAHFFVRAQASSDLYHVITRDDAKFSLSYIPVGILSPTVQKCYLAPGMFIDIKAFLAELSMLEKKDIQVKGRVRLSTAAHVIMPYHHIIDACAHDGVFCKTAMNVKKGLASATADKAMGVGIRIADIIHPDFPEILRGQVDRSNKILTSICHQKPLDYSQLLKEYNGYKDLLLPFVKDRVEYKINQLLSQNQRGIFEGTHGTYMDHTHGTYPYTAPGETTASAICASAGIGPTRIKYALGIVKAYATHLGEGPFPTEIKNQKVLKSIQNAVAKSAIEPYRFGWIDLVKVRQAVALNGINYVALTRLDDLTGLDKIKVCIDYDVYSDKQKEPIHFDFPPPCIQDYAKVEPHYIEFDGWKEDISGITHFSNLPESARYFVKMIEKILHVPIVLISIGPKPEQTLVLDDILSW